MNIKTNSVVSWLTNKRDASSAPPLGGRELAVMEQLWAQGELSAQDILDQAPGGDISLSTVQSTLERLHRKEMVMRKKHQRAYVYTPRVTRSQIISALLRDISQEIAGGDMAPMVSGFIDYLESTEDPSAKTVLGQALAEQQVPSTSD